MEYVATISTYNYTVYSAIHRRIIISRGGIDTYVVASLGLSVFKDVLRGFSNTNASQRVAGGAGLTCWWCGFSNTNACRRVAGGVGLTCWWCGFSNTNACRRGAGDVGLTCWWCGFFNTKTQVPGLRCVCVVTYVPSYNSGDSTTTHQVGAQV